MINVKLLEHTPNPENVVANAARLCYSDLDIEDLFNKHTDEQNQKMIENLMSLGHESPIEHVYFTFGIEGVSRTLTHQLVRHRIASYSQQSQRYVRLNQFEYVIPQHIENNPRAKELFVKAMEEDQKYYDEILNILYDDHYRNYVGEGINPRIAAHKAEKEAMEDARYVFPNACETKIIVTMNVRTLLNFFKLRSCRRAQHEIMQLSDKMLIECKKVAPSLFKYAGANCMHGKCPEGNMSCGKPRKVSEYE